MKKQEESREIIERIGISNWERKIISLRKQGELKNRWLDYRINHVLPEIMNREKLDMWIISAREYNEDPVIMSFLPSPMITARRRTILVFFKKEDSTIPPETQWECLGRVIRGRDPKTIGINFSEGIAFADGLTHTEYENFIKT